jgi:hypothetical protein
MSDLPASTVTPAAKRHPAGAPCSMCKELTKPDSSTLRCLHCENSMHVSCHYKLYKDANRELSNTKIKLDWIADFIKFSALAYRCKACLKKYDTSTPNSPTISKAPKAQDMIDVKQSIAAIDVKLQSLHKEVATIAALDVKLQSLCNEVTKLQSSNTGDGPFKS